MKRRRQRDLLRGFEEFGIDRPVVRPVLFFLDAQECWRRADTRPAGFSVVGAEQLGHGVGARKQPHQIVVDAEAEYGGKHVMTRTFGAELYAQPFGDELDDSATISPRCRSVRGGSRLYCAREHHVPSGRECKRRRVVVA